jgi:D-tyrosyl-tRNA(Tyr) deacylase
MKCLVQRVKSSSVDIENNEYSHINQGLLLFLGVEKGDDSEICKKMSDKILKLRIFADEEDKMNLSVCDIKGEILAVSQFTLCADCKKGNRPRFDTAEKPDIANKLYEEFVQNLKLSGLNVQTGVFGAMMQVKIQNDGPVTFMLQM